MCAVKVRNAKLRNYLKQVYLTTRIKRMYHLLRLYWRTKNFFPICTATTIERIKTATNFTRNLKIQDSTQRWGGSSKFKVKNNLVPRFSIFALNSSEVGAKIENLGTRFSKNLIENGCTCSFVVLPQEMSPIWKNVKPNTGKATRPHITIITILRIS
jgi:hypothetical protein